MYMFSCHVQCIDIVLAGCFLVYNCSWWLGQSLILQVAKKASVLKRRKSRNRMEVPGTPQEPTKPDPPVRCDSEADVVFYMEEPKSGKLFLSFRILRK